MYCVFSCKISSENPCPDWCVFEDLFGGIPGRIGTGPACESGVIRGVSYREWTNPVALLILFCSALLVYPYQQCMKIIRKLPSARCIPNMS